MQVVLVFRGCKHNESTVEFLFDLLNKLSLVGWRRFVERSHDIDLQLKWRTGAIVRDYGVALAMTARTMMAAETIEEVIGEFSP